MHNNEDLLIAWYEKGDRKALGAIVQHFQKSVYSICLRVLSDPSLADDATQECFRRILQTRSYKAGKPAQSWILTIAYNTALTFSQDKQVTKHVTNKDRVDSSPSAQDAMEQDELWNTLRQFVSGLEPEIILNLHLRFFENCTYETISEITSSPESTVRTRIQRGLQQLKDRLHMAGYAAMIPGMESALEHSLAIPVPTSTMQKLQTQLAQYPPAIHSPLPFLGKIIMMKKSIAAIALLLITISFWAMDVWTHPERPSLFSNSLNDVSNADSDSLSHINKNKQPIESNGTLGTDARHNENQLNAHSSTTQNTPTMQETEETSLAIIDNELGRVQGRIYDAISYRPISFATVQLRKHSPKHLEDFDPHDIDDIFDRIMYRAGTVNRHKMDTSKYILYETTCDKNGYYVIEGVEKKLYSITARSDQHLIEDFYTISPNEKTYADGTVGDQTLTADIYLLPLGRVYGQVLDESGKPVVGKIGHMSVILDSETGGFWLPETDKNGKYTSPLFLNSLEYSSVYRSEISFEIDGYLPAVSSKLVVKWGGQYEINITLLTGNTINGVVVDEFGLPKSNIEIEYTFEKKRHAKQYKTTSDKNGHYQIDGIQNNSEVFITRLGNGKARNNVLTIETDNRNVDLIFAPLKMIAFSGFVTDEKGHAAESGAVGYNTNVVASDSSITYTKTNKQGWYELLVPEHATSLEAGSVGHYSSKVKITIDADNTNEHNLDFQLLPFHVILMTVTDSNTGLVISNFNARQEVGDSLYPDRINFTQENKTPSIHWFLFDALDQTGVPPVNLISKITISAHGYKQKVTEFRQKEFNDFKLNLNIKLDPTDE